VQSRITQNLQELSLLN